MTPDARQHDRDEPLLALGDRDARTTDARDLRIRIATIVGVLAIGAFGLASGDTVLRGALAWFGFLMCVLSGWGFLVVRIARVRDVDFGLRAAWGIAGYLAVAGILVALGICTRPVILALVALGAAGFAWRELTAPRASWHTARDGIAWMRAHPALGALAAVLVLVALVHVLGAIAALDRNPWDDDLAYTPMVRRLLDTGDLVEPFSFRRLGAYGGQTALQAVVAARGSLANVHLFDQGICFVLVLLLIAGHARERGTSLRWLALLLLVVELMPNTAINTASYWSGAALFFALYRTFAARSSAMPHASGAPDSPPSPSNAAPWALVGLVGAATCTLRQSYLPIVVVFVGVALLCDLASHARIAGWRAAWRDDRKRWGVIAGVAILALAGWWIAMVRSSDTFLFPLISGTFNQAVALRPTGVTWAGELAFLVWCCAEPAPIVAVAPLAIVVLVGRDRRSTKLLVALFAATVVGFFALVHAFAGYEAHQLWRYMFGPGLALLAALVLDHGDANDATGASTADATGASTARFAIPTLGRWLLFASLVIQLVASRGALAKYVPAVFDDIRHAGAIDRDGDPAVDATRARYAALQASVPAGETMAVMLDEPYYLDFARNRIVNLDTPAYASPGRHTPVFNGPGALHQYLVDHGIRYVAFVRSDASHYFYRRPFWVWRLFSDAEPFAVMSAYTLDAIDTVAALTSETTVVYDADGFVALDLDGGATSVLHRAGSEADRRHAFVRELADREGLHDAWSLNPRADLVFEDGFTGLAIIEPSMTEPKPAREDSIRRGIPVRTFNRRAHLRIRGTGDHHLRLRGHVTVALVPTRPRLDIALAGDLLASTTVDDHGAFAIDVVVGADRLGDDWRDLYLLWSGVVDPKQDSRDPRVARLENVEWEAR